MLGIINDSAGVLHKLEITLVLLIPWVRADIICTLWNVEAGPLQSSALWIHKITSVLLCWPKPMQNLCKMPKTPHHSKISTQPHYCTVWLWYNPTSVYSRIKSHIKKTATVLPATEKKKMDRGLRSWRDFTSVNNSEMGPEINFSAEEPPSKKFLLQLFM